MPVCSVFGQLRSLTKFCWLIYGLVRLRKCACKCGGNFVNPYFLLFANGVQQ